MKQSATITELAAHRRKDDVLGSVTLVFGGVNYGTVPVRAAYSPGKPFALYLIPSATSETRDGERLCGPLDCLITDDVGLALDEAR